MSAGRKSPTVVMPVRCAITLMSPIWSVEGRPHSPRETSVRPDERSSAHGNRSSEFANGVAPFFAGVQSRAAICSPSRKFNSLRSAVVAAFHQRAKDSIAHGGEMQ